VDYVRSPEDGGAERAENLMTTCAECNTRGDRKAP
jgi:5-methylcytosine-specific restriction endonuclease McrA